MMRWLLPLAVLAASPVFAAEQSYPLTGFTNVANATSIDVEVRVGRPFRVIATGDASRLARLRVETRGDTLLIDSRGSTGWSTGKAKVLVELPSLAGISLAGSGDGHVDTAKGAAFRAATTGSGDLVVDRIDAAQARLSSTGSGNITAAGKAGQLEATTTGSGDLDLGGLAATTLVARSTGSGDITVGPASTADARTSGSGDISVAGSPRCQVRSSGSGTVRCG